MPHDAVPVSSAQDLSAAVGAGRRSPTPDLLWLRAALTALGRHTTAEVGHAFIDRALDDAIRSYQRDRGLRVDGWLAPSGPTHRHLCFDLVSLEGC